MIRGTTDYGLNSSSGDHRWPLCCTLGTLVGSFRKLKEVDTRVSNQFFILSLQHPDIVITSLGTGTAEEGGVASGEAPVAAALPEFDPWGSRPPPKTYQ